MNERDDEPSTARDAEVMDAPFQKAGLNSAYEEEKSVVNEPENPHISQQTMLEAIEQPDRNT